MSHYFELDGIRERIFILQCLAMSGESFSKEYSIGFRDGNSLYSQKEYWRLTKSLVSNGVLELAIKIRNSYESLGLSNNHKIMVCIENDEVTRHDFIWVCNKIVHAKTFNLGPVGSSCYEDPLEWWGGDIRITGDMHGRLWDISFNSDSWLKSCLFYVQSMEKSLLDSRDKSGDLTRCI